MPVYFIDSSALVKRYRHEVGSDRLAQLLNQAERAIIARLAQLEVSSAIVRRGRAAGASAHELNVSLAALDNDVDNSFDVVELDRTVIQRAIILTRAHALRAADSIQLACAILARDEEPHEVHVFIGSDRELNAAAAAEGMQTVDPTSP